MDGAQKGRKNPGTLLMELFEIRLLKCELICWVFLKSQLFLYEEEGKGRETSAFLFLLNSLQQYQISKMKSQPWSVAFSGPLSISSHSFEDCEWHKVTQLQKAYKNAYKRESTEIYERNFCTKDIHKNRPPSNLEKLKGIWDMIWGEFSG